MISSAPARVRLTWLLSPPLARATNNRPAVMFQPSDSYTCSTIPLEHRLNVSSQLGPAGGGQWLRKWVGPTAPHQGNMCARRVSDPKCIDRKGTKRTLVVFTGASVMARKILGEGWNLCELGLITTTCIYMYIGCCKLTTSRHALALRSPNFVTLAAL